MHTYVSMNAYINVYVNANVCVVLEPSRALSMQLCTHIHMHTCVYVNTYLQTYDLF